MEKVIVTYHKDCIDGTTAAAVVLRKFPDALLFPLNHAYTKKDMEPILAVATPEAKIYTVDAGLGAPELLERGYSVTTIDHHIGAKETFETLARENANYMYIFDNEKSGASLTWSHFFPEEEMPELITYVEDADLWRWKYGKTTKDVNNYLSMFRNDPSAMLKFVEGELEEIQEKGSIISMYADKEIENQVEMPSVTVRICTYEVPAYNITVYQSASGNILAEQQNKAVAMFTVKGDRVKWSFRSKEHHVPTSLELAKLLGAGGHKNASGAETSLKEFIDMIV